MAAGNDSVSLWGSDDFHTLLAFVVQVTADMPGGDKDLNATGHNGRCPNRYRDFHGVYCGSHYYFPPTHPSSGEMLFSVSSPTISRRESGSFRAHAAEVEKAQIYKRSARYIVELGKQTGVKGPSLLFTPCQQDQSKYPTLKCIRDLGPILAPYDAMHLNLQNVVPFLWKLFSGKIAIQADEDEPYYMPSVDAIAVGHEIGAAKATVPVSQARALRDVHVRFRTYKMVERMVFILSTGDAVLSDRISDTAFPCTWPFAKHAVFSSARGRLRKKNFTRWMVT